MPCAGKHAARMGEQRLIPHAMAPVIGGSAPDSEKVVDISVASNFPIACLVCETN